MSGLGIGLFFILIFAVGISCLALMVNSRLERFRMARQLPLPIDGISSSFGGGLRFGVRPVMTVVGFMLLFYAAMGAAFLGRLATMQPAEAVAIFEIYPLLQDMWRLLLGVGPITCMAMSALGTCLINSGLESGRT